MVAVTVSCGLDQGDGKRSEHVVSVPLDSSSDLGALRLAIVKAAEEANRVLTEAKDRLGEGEKAKEREWIRQEESRQQHHAPADGSESSEEEEDEGEDEADG